MITSRLGRRTQPGRSRRRGFTLIELLVVIAVIGILASLLMPAVLMALRSAQTANCIGHVGQIMKSFTVYNKDFDVWMPCGGNRDDHDRAMPLDTPYLSPWNTSATFPFWYEALQPYVSSGSTPAQARASLVARGIASPSADQIREEQARLCGVFTCPAKKQVSIGYGYHYLAVFGNNSIYPAYGFKWSDGGGNPAYNFPANYGGARQPIPMLWWGQSIVSSGLTSPSEQIAICDTGWVTNDPSLTVAPKDWQENNTNNITGYVRFPISDAYKASAYYKSSRPWRPVPRHNGKTVCANFDASAKCYPTEDIVNYAWTNPKCLFDNKPPSKPPIPSIQE